MATWHKAFQSYLFDIQKLITLEFHSVSHHSKHQDTISRPENYSSWFLISLRLRRAVRLTGEFGHVSVTQEMATWRRWL